MRFDLLEIPVFKSSKIESREKGDYNKYRHSELKLCKQSLPEHACISQVLEPHPVGNESDEHDKKCQNKSYDHDCH